MTRTAERFGAQASAPTARRTTRRTTAAGTGASAEVVHLTRAERVAAGRALRRTVPRSSHAELPDVRRGRDPLALLQSQDAGRVPELLPIRYARMAASPFAFYRGAAEIMADDLAETPRTGIDVQVCGDAHLSNFGLFASPERRLVFDINDFDETLPGPWEWDVKRLATSLEVAGRENGYRGKERRAIVEGSVAAYRAAMRDLAGKTTLEVWYTHITAGGLRHAERVRQLRPAGGGRAAPHADGQRHLPRLDRDDRPRRAEP